MLEKEFQGIVTKWMKKNAWGSFPYELKVTKGETLPFSSFRPQQIPSLNKANTGILHYKISDAGLIAPAPFDAFVYKKSNAYVGILFNKDKKNRTAHFMDIEDVMEIKEAGKKSISLKDAKVLGIEIDFNKLK